MKRIWRLTEPRGSVYAEPALRGAWKEGRLCPECTGSTGGRIQPLIVEWQPGSDQIADFSWPSLGDVLAITERVHRLLAAAQFSGYEPGPVEMIQNPKLRRPERPTKRTKKRVWLPYEGPPLYEVWLTTTVHMIRERSTARLVKSCSKCGREVWELEGQEEWSYEVEIKDRGDYREYTDYYVHHPRVPGRGVFINSADLAGADIFEVQGFGWIFCTDRLKSFIEEHAFSNVEFLEMGEMM